MFIFEEDVDVRGYVPGRPLPFLIQDLLTGHRPALTQSMLLQAATIRTKSGRGQQQPRLDLWFLSTIHVATARC